MFHRQIISAHRSWRKRNDCLNVFGCDRSRPGIDFLAASGFENVGSGKS
jgi:hypothetical protein